MGRQFRGSERPARGAGAGEQASGVQVVEEVGEGVAAKDADVVLARGAPHRVAVHVHYVSEEMDKGVRRRYGYTQSTISLRVSRSPSAGKYTLAW